MNTVASFLPENQTERFAIFEKMLAHSESTTDNMSETGILRASVARTKKALEAAKK